jgi:xanthine dehydrogenase accessory factor
MSLPEIRDAVLDWTRRGQPWGEAVLIGVRRSAPRPPGARYAAGSDGSFSGTISAGCVEADLREHILGLLADRPDGEPKVVSYGISDEMAVSVGLACGGEIDVLIRLHEPDDAVWEELVAMLVESSGAPAGGHGALVTGLSAGILGRQILVRRDGSTVGSLGDSDLDEEVAASADRLFAREGGETVEFASGGHTAFVDRVLPPRRLLIVGATPVAIALAALASCVGYQVTVVDPRPGLARPILFPDANVIVEWPDQALDATDLDEWTDVAILAHDDRLDLQGLQAALTSGCRYTGLLGGRRTQRLRREALLARGVSSPSLDRIRGPIGLDIGAVTPHEIAVSILAEMLAVRRLGPQAVGRAT